MIGSQPTSAKRVAPDLPGRKGSPNSCALRNTQWSATMPIDLDQLRTFVSVAEAGGLSAAAETLNLAAGDLAAPDGPGG